MTKQAADPGESGGTSEEGTPEQSHVNILEVKGHPREEMSGA